MIATTKHPLANSGATLCSLKLSQIAPHPLNPRKDFNEGEIRELAESLEGVGLIEPLLVRRVPHSKGAYQLIAGERRLRAAALLGWATIQAIVIDADDQQVLAMQLVENLQRKDLNPIEIARALDALCRSKSDGGAGRSQGEVAKMLGKSSTWVNCRIGLLRLPDVWIERVAAGEVGMFAAKCLAAYASEPEILAAIDTDMKANPWAYRTSGDIERSLRRIVKEVGSSGNVHGRTGKPATTKRLPQVAAARVLQLPAGVAAPSVQAKASTAKGGPTDDVAALLARIAEIESLADLERVEFAVAERREALGNRILSN
jgi:ParB/RepB/Spo0J family partition protein